MQAATTVAQRRKQKAHLGLGCCALHTAVGLEAGATEADWNIREQSLRHVTACVRIKRQNEAACVYAELVVTNGGRAVFASQF